VNLLEISGNVDLYPNSPFGIYEDEIPSERDSQHIYYSNIYPVLLDFILYIFQICNIGSISIHFGGTLGVSIR